VVRAVWTLTLPSAEKWRVRAADEARYAVVVRYRVDERVLDRVATLFPGESAFWLEMPSR
jgi:hypothetical protein